MTAPPVRSAPTSPRSRNPLTTDRRLWALGFLVLLVAPSFILLSRWQFHRLDERRADNYLITSRFGTAPVPVSDVLAAGGTPVTDAQVWKRVTASGTYDAAATRLVRKQPLNGSNGFWVMTPLVGTEGTRLVVNRGWIPAGPDATTSPPIPPPPAGVVDVTGRVRASVPGQPRPGDIPADQVTSADVAQVAPGSRTYTGYIELESSVPQESLVTPWPLPDVDEGPHLSYALQWIAFAVTAVVGFVIIVRGESRRVNDDTVSPATTDTG